MASENISPARRVLKTEQKMFERPGRLARFAALLLSALIACPCLAQAPTAIGAHKIGETLQQWITITHALDNLDTVCNSKKRGLQGKVDKENCARLVKLRDGKLPEIITNDAGRGYTWHFDDGVLSSAIVAVPDLLAPLNVREAVDVQQEIALLTQAYGEPIDAHTVPYQNAFGATWQCSRVYWSMPDGTKIAAIESINSSDQFRHVLTIVFATQAAINRDAPPPNPYLKK